MAELSRELEAWESREGRGASVGRVAQLGPDGRVWVDFSGNPGDLLLARLAIPLGETLAVGQVVLLVFDEGNADCPIILGKVRDRVAEEEMPSRRRTQGRDPIARVDGQRVVLEGREEVELRCGKASVTLRKDGKILIKGVQLVSQAEGTNRIKGGTVAIN